MILIITNKQDYTADFLILRLQARGIEFVRLNTEDFPTEIQLNLNYSHPWIDTSFISVYGKKVYMHEVKGVWYRRPKLPLPHTSISSVKAREFVIAESQYTLEAFWQMLDCVWVSKPAKLIESEYKPFQLLVARRVGFAIPKTLITNEPKEAQQFIDSYKDVVYKPLKRGYFSDTDNNSIGLIYTNVITASDLDNLSSVAFAPCLFQVNTPKLFELRITVVGSRVFAVRLDSQQSLNGTQDWRRADISTLKHQAYRLPTTVEEKCVNLVAELGLSFGAIDIIVTPENEYIFLEINPNGQWAWIEQLLPDVNISDALIDHLKGDSD